MLFQMCYFRIAILSERWPRQLTPAINQLRNIFARYQELYDDDVYKLLFLENVDYSFIKKILPDGAAELDAQQDPIEILTGRLDAFFNGTNGIADRFIYGNPYNDSGIYYVHQLVDPANANTNLQDLISLNVDSFRDVRPDTPDKKYIILNYPRLVDAGGKKTNIVTANPVIRINDVSFVLKGIIVHSGNGNEGHYVYVTFKDNGGIDKIYNNSQVTNFETQELLQGTPEETEVILKNITTDFTAKMNKLDQTTPKYKKDVLKTIYNTVLKKNYLLGYNKTRLNEEFATFALLFNEAPPRANAEMFKKPGNTIDFNNYTDFVRRNGTTFLYEKVLLPAAATAAKARQRRKQSAAEVTVPLGPTAPGPTATVPLGPPTAAAEEPPVTIEENCRITSPANTKEAAKILGLSVLFDKGQKNFSNLGDRYKELYNKYTQKREQCLTETNRGYIDKAYVLITRMLKLETAKEAAAAPGTGIGTPVRGPTATTAAKVPATGTGSAKVPATTAAPATKAPGTAPGTATGPASGTGPPGPPGATGAPTGAAAATVPPGPATPQINALKEATLIAMRLFEIPFNKTFFKIIKPYELFEKKRALIKKLENNTLNPNLRVNTLVNLKNIINEAYNYLTIILENLSNLILGNSLNHLPLERLNTFYTKLNPTIINRLLNFVNFVPQYKQLTFNESTIILRPRINQTRKATSTAICNELGQLNPLINSLRGIPSQMRKLTRRVNLESIQKNIKIRTDTKATQKAKADEEAKQAITNQMETSRKSIEDKKQVAILARINQLSGEITALAEPDPGSLAVDRQRFINRLREKQKELANLKRELTAELDKEARAKKTKETTDRITKLTSEITALRNIAGNTDNATTKRQTIKEINAKREEIAQLEKEQRNKGSKGGNSTRKVIYLSKPKNKKQTKKFRNLI